MSGVLGLVGYLIPAACVGVGLSFVISGARRGRDWLVLRRRGAVGEATVTDVRTEWHESSGENSTGHYVYYPVLGFATADGRQVQTVAANGTSSERYSVGDVIDVQYDRADPTHAYAENVLSGSAWPFVKTLLGLGVTIFGVYLFFQWVL